MKMEKMSRLHSALSLFLSALILILSPGLGSYSAFAEAESIEFGQSGEGNNLSIEIRIDSSKPEQVAPLDGEVPAGPALFEGVHPADAEISLGGTDIVPEASDSNQTQGDGRAEPAADKKGALPADNKGQAPSLRRQLETGEAQIGSADETSKRAAVDRFFGELATMYDLKAPTIEKLPETVQKASSLKDEEFLSRKVVGTRLRPVDLETTGVNPGIDRITDFGEIPMRVGPDAKPQFLEGGIDELVDSEGQPLSERITELTGITPGDLKGRRHAEQVLRDFVGSLAPDDVIVVHNASFEASFFYLLCRLYGIPVPKNMILDTMVLARRVIANLASAAMRNLILLPKINIGEIEAHRGAADARQEGQLAAILLKMIADKNNKKMADLDWRDVAQANFTANKDSLAVHVEDMWKKFVPRAVEPERRRPLPGDILNEVRRVSNELYKAKKPNELPDVAYELGVPLEELFKAMQDASLKIKVSKADETLENISKKAASVAAAGKEFAVVFGLNGTLADLRADGKYARVSPQTIENIVSLLKAGVAVVVAAGLAADKVAKTLTAEIPQELTSRFFVSGIGGKELANFDPESLLYMDDFNQGAFLSLPKAGYVNSGGIPAGPLPSTVADLTLKGSVAVERVTQAILQGLERVK